MNIPSAGRLSHSWLAGRNDGFRFCAVCDKPSISRGAFERKKLHTHTYTGLRAILVSAAAWHRESTTSSFARCIESQQFGLVWKCSRLVFLVQGLPKLEIGILPHWIVMLQGTLACGVHHEYTFARQRCPKPPKSQTSPEFLDFPDFELRSLKTFVKQKIGISEYFSRCVSIFCVLLSYRFPSQLSSINGPWEGA